MTAEEKRDHERRVQDEKLNKLDARMDAVEARLDRMNDNIEGLINAWNTGKGASAFLIATAKLATAGTVIWALLKNVKWSQLFL